MVRLMRVIGIISATDASFAPPRQTGRAEQAARLGKLRRGDAYPEWSCAQANIVQHEWCRTRNHGVSIHSGLYGQWPSANTRVKLIAGLAKRPAASIWNRLREMSSTIKHRGVSIISSAYSNDVVTGVKNLRRAAAT